MHGFYMYCESEKTCNEQVFIFFAGQTRGYNKNAS